MIRITDHRRTEMTKANIGQPELPVPADIILCLTVTVDGALTIKVFALYRVVKKGPFLTEVWV